MSSVQYLRKFIRERLTAAAEEIFTEVEKTIVRYEEKIILLEICGKPQINLNRLELQRQFVSYEEESLAIQQPCNQRRRSSHDQGKVVPQSSEEDQRELENVSPPIKEPREPAPSLIKEENEKPEKPTSATAEHKEPDLQLMEKQDKPGATWIKEEESKYSLLELKEGLDYSLPKHEQWQAEHLPARHDQEDLLSIQEEKQLIQKQSITLETFTVQEQDFENLEPRSEQPSFYISTVVETEDLEGTSYNVTESQSQTDTKKKSFKCDICGRSYKNNSTMKQHYRTHTGERPFPCKTCGESFYRVNSLNAHIRTHTGEKHLQCKICGKSFSWMSSLKYHIRTHTGEKPFPCTICGKRFTQMSDLKIHIRTHTGERPFSCETCGKSFARLHTLTTHIRTHKGDKYLTCESWKKLYSDTSFK